MSEIISIVSASASRRVIGIAMMLGLGGLMIFLALGPEVQAIVIQVPLLAFGLAVLFLAEKMRRATALRLELTGTQLRDSSGRVLASVDQIQAIDRGMFAMKPSNGFMLKLNAAQGAAWMPGLYWRLGRRVGVGGVTSPGQTKFMSEMLTAMLAERRENDGPPD